MNRITSRLRLLIWRTETERFNPLMYPFLLATAAYGIFFVFGDPGISSLYAAMSRLGNALPVVWGWAMVSVTILNVVTLMVRKKWIGSPTAFLGFLCWVFASMVYVVDGAWIVFFSVALPNTIFWLWYYFRIQLYRKLVQKNEILDAKELAELFESE